MSKSTKKVGDKKKRRKNPDCPHCRTGSETFRYSKSVFKFDVDLAREIVGDGREPIELHPDDVKHSVDTTRIYSDHVQHVDPQYPGIVAQIWYPEPNGTLLHGDTLIDGHHRAARCLQDSLPYRVYVLTEEESQRILIKGPDKAEAQQIADAAREHHQEELTAAH